MITNCEFGQSGPAADDAARSGGRGALAARLAAAQRVLAAIAVDDDVRARFQRRLTAICDALKAPVADAARCARRLDLLLSDLGPEAQAAEAGQRGQGAAAADPEAPTGGS